MVTTIVQTTRDTIDTNSNGVYASLTRLGVVENQPIDKFAQFMGAKKEARWYGPASNNGAEGFWEGQFTLAGGGSLNKQIDSAGLHSNLITTSTLNNLTYYRTSNLIERDLNPVFAVNFKLSQTTTTRMFIGFSSQSAPTSNADPLASASGIGLWYDSAVNANWRIYSNNGGGSSTNANTTIPADTTQRTLVLVADNANTKFKWSLSGSALADVTSTIPAATTDMNMQAHVETLSGGVTVSMDLFDWYGRIDK